MTAYATPDAILEIGFAFRRSKVLLSAVELDLFTVLRSGPYDCETLAEAIGIHNRSAHDFFNALVSLQLIELDDAGRYTNGPDCAVFLDRNSPDYIGGLLLHLNARMYDIWGQLTLALRSGCPQSGALGSGGYEALYADPSIGELFIQAMTAGSLLPSRHLAIQFPWSRYKTFADVGTAQGCLPVEIARVHSHLAGVGFDLPAVSHLFDSYVGRHDLGTRVTFQAGNFMLDPLPRADVLVLGRVLHNWDLATKQLLLRKAYNAIPAGGAIIVYDPVLDDERRSDGNGLFASLTMLLETAAGFEYRARDCQAWMRNAGFGETQVEPLPSYCTAIIAHKS